MSVRECIENVLEFKNYLLSQYERPSSAAGHNRFESSRARHINKEAVVIHGLTAHRCIFHFCCKKKLFDLHLV